MLNTSGPKIDPCGTPEKISFHRQYQSLFFVCGFEGSYALTSKPEVIGHKHLILRLTDHDIYSRMLSINL